MHPVHTYPVKPSLRQQSDPFSYDEMYQESIQHPEQFWRKHAHIIDWIKPFTQVKNTSFQPGHIQVEWFADGQLNACVNCVDRHLPERADHTALIWEGDQPGQNRSMTFRTLHQEVCRCANILKMLGIQRGDVVAIYMPMLLESCIAMLACARIGAVHTVVFGGFSAESLASRIDDCQAKLLITADGGFRGGRLIPLKNNADHALVLCNHKVNNMLVWQHAGCEVSWSEHRDVWWHKAALQVDDQCAAASMQAEDPLFILYTSGSTGQAKGILHTTGGYLVYAAMTFKYIFDHQADDVYWSTADIGWITGHTYLVYGPLANAATTLIYEGTPSYPTDHRIGEIIDRHQVTLFYTAPTLIRALMAKQDLVLEDTKRTSLRVMGSVGESINPEAWEWYYHQFANQQAAIMDTWWQTETGGVMITPLPGVHNLKAGAALRPFFGVQPAIVNPHGEILEGVAEGALVVLDSWPGQMRSVYGDPQRYEQTYFAPYPNMYFTGDGARRDADGDFWITGRIDDVINVSGHRLGTAEIETAIDAHDRVAEAAVVGVPHPIKGQAIYAYVILNFNEYPNQTLENELKAIVRQEIGGFAVPECFHWTQGLPKTRSGKILRRILRKIAAGEFEQLGDISTLADPSVIEQLIRTHSQAEAESAKTFA